MSSKAIHIIQKQCYDIAVPNEQYGIQLQQGLQQMNINYIVPAVSSKLDQLFQGEDVVVIEKLEINIGKIKTHAEPEEWVEKILAGLETSVKLMGFKKHDSEQNEIVTIRESEHAIKTWMYFLATGMMPADTIFKTVAALMQVIFLFNTEEKKVLKNEMLQHSFSDAIMQRLSLMDAAALLFFIQLLLPEIKANDWNQLKENIIVRLSRAASENKLPSQETSLTIQNKMVLALLQKIWQIAAEGTPITAREFQKIADIKFEELLLQKTSNKAMANKIDDIAREKITQKNIADSELENEIAAQGIFVNNAGLCLLAPYLGMFFKAMELSDDHQFFNKTKQQHAIYLVHHLATGQTDAPEEQLVFAKLLCGWPLQMPCINNQPITDTEISESNELLVSVISNWQALKNTTPDGLREAFLQRTGKLVMEDNQYILQVAQQSIDILLESIPWTFRMLKLPWMQKMVKVEWF